MEQNIINRVYDFLNHMVHPSDELTDKIPKIKRCPITGLDISMQLQNTKFLSASGVEWYYMHEREIFIQFLAVRMSESLRKKNLKLQFKGIAHSIRNSESNLRNNTKRSIHKLLRDKNSLFDNMSLIDKNKLLDAGIIKE